MHHDDKLPIAISLDELKTMAAGVAAAMRGGEPLPPEVRERFTDVRAALFQRGVYDPLLVRFDSATVARATLDELAERLEAVAASLR